MTEDHMDHTEPESEDSPLDQAGRLATPGHMDHTEPVSDATPGSGGYETRDANIYALLRFAVGLVVAMVAVQFAMLGFYRMFEKEQPEETNLEVRKTENLYQQLKGLRDDEDAVLTSYEIDRKTGNVRIPIGRAMDLLVEKGVPFGKGPKTELEMNSHGTSPVPGDDGEDARRSSSGEGPRKPSGGQTIQENPLDRTRVKP